MMNVMRALAIRQPYAELIPRGTGWIEYGFTSLTTRGSRPVFHPKPIAAFKHSLSSCCMDEERVPSV
jgi:hypothetical protein